MNLERVQYLLSNPEEGKSGNCYSACLFVHNLVDSLDAVGEKYLERVLQQHFDKINPNETAPQKGDILCMCYVCNAMTREMSFQHVFCYWDEYQVFQKDGPSPGEPYRLCSIVNAVFPYSSRQAVMMLDGSQNWNTVPVSQFFSAHPCNFLYRRKKETRACHIV